MSKDGIAFLYDDHDKLKTLFSDWKRSSTNGEKKTVVKNIIRDVVAHASAEERYLYPLIREKKIGGENGELFYQRNLVDDQINKEILYFLDSNEPKTDAEWSLYNQTVDKFITVELEHLHMEEKEVLEVLRSGLTEAQKTKLYDNLVWGKKTAPVHPHPMEPLKPSTGNTILAPVVGVIEQGVEKLKITMGYNKGTETTGSPVLIKDSNIINKETGQVKDSVGGQRDSGLVKDPGMINKESGTINQDSGMSKDLGVGTHKVDNPESSLVDRERVDNLQ
jgi:hemerythrin superfamily protein